MAKTVDRQVVNGVEYQLMDTISRQGLNDLSGAFMKSTREKENGCLWNAGSISATNGANATSSTRIRTAGYVDADNIIGITTDPGYEFALFAYAKTDSAYIGALKSDNTFTNTSAGVVYQGKRIMPDFPAYKYRLVLRNANDPTASIDVSESENLLFTVNAVDETETEERLGTAMEGIEDIADGENYVTVFRKTGKDWLQIGAINASGEEVTSSNSYRTGFLACKPFEKITSAMTLSTQSGYYHYVCFYDANQDYIADSRIGGALLKTVNANAPEGTAYFRVSLTYVGLSAVSAYTVTVGHPNNGSGSGSERNKWYILGDSISAGYYSITDEEAAEKGVRISYRPAGLEGVGAVWDRTLVHTYWGYANEWFLHRVLVPLAYPGQGYLRVSADDLNGILKVKNTDFSDAGLITVAWGFNDWHYNLNRGDHELIDPTVKYPGAGYDISQLTTVNHAIWYCLGELIRKAPNAKIVVQTPMNGWLYGGDFDSNWGIGHEMTNSGTLADIHDDIKYWADYYGLQVLDMTYNNSMVNRLNIKDVMIDGSHPTDPAHQQLGRHVSTMLGYC